MSLLLWFAYLAFSLTILYRAGSPRIWEIGSAIYLVIATFVIGIPWLVALLMWSLIIGIMVVLRVEPILELISDFAFERVAQSIPKLSKTEEEALNCGDVWLEKGIFMGEPDWSKLAEINPSLTSEEQDFLNIETEILCEMLDDWDIVQQRDLPAEVWAYLKEKGFFALVIDKKYGGKGFSARAHSDIVVKIASRSGSAAVTVMVPNSLGPAELLQHYGTQAQKSHYLPRLANGTDIPCFALTEPGAGSDATSIVSEAIVTHKKIDGEMILGLELTLEKRWITLAPIATLIGLAVNLKDPNGLLKGEGEEGITCVLIQRDTPNLEIGNRHLPAEMAFMNGTIRGKQIFVPIDNIIGGQKKAGQGWSMLVECLSIGRSISLPALASASSSIAYLTTGAYSRIRNQFNADLVQFEGVQEKLAEIAGLNYLINATRILTVAAVNEHKKPSVASAITKYFNTELSRVVLNHAMDIHAGRAVVMGPRNYLAGHYQALPISLTVEGANIMTRNLLIFGQGSIACHPFIREEFYAIAKQDKDAFKTLFWDHVTYFCRNFAKTICSAWTAGRLIQVPNGSMKREYQLLSRLSFAYAWLADLSLMILGGDLKRRERLSARLADGMSYLYLAMAALRYAQDGKDEEHIHAKWAVQYCFHHTQKALMMLCDNFPNRFIGILAKWVAFPFGLTMRYPSDKSDRQLATTMCQNNSYREKIIKSLYLNKHRDQPVGRMEYAFQLILEHAELYKKVPELKRCKWNHLKHNLAEMLNNGLISQEEMEVIIQVEKAKWDAIQVDEFTSDALKKEVIQPANVT